MKLYTSLQSLSLPTPDKLTVTKKDVAEVTRSVTGQAQVQHIATKRYLVATWTTLSASQVRLALRFLDACKPYFFVEYEDVEGTQSFLAFLDEVSYELENGRCVRFTISVVEV